MISQRSGTHIVRAINSSENITMAGEIVVMTRRDAETVDRISDLPDFILHIILSMLDAKKACCASVLSKRWYSVWSSIPVLDFQPQYFKDYERYDPWKFAFDDTDDFFDDTLERYVEFIDSTMQRYSTHEYRITKLCLVLHKFEKKLEPLVDKWISIAVQSQIQELHIRMLFIRDQNYRLPEDLFRAKSLRVLTCKFVGIPYYETMELISLKCLSLVPWYYDENMLQRIISCSPLVDLNIFVSEDRDICLTWTRKLTDGDVCFGRDTMQSRLKESSLNNIVYCDFVDFPWERYMNVGALKNVRKLELIGGRVRGHIVSMLVSGLLELESLYIHSCYWLECQCIKISSSSLKEFRFLWNRGFTSATIDAPNLLRFHFSCTLDVSLSLIRMPPDYCNAAFYPNWNSQLITIDWFDKLKMFFKETNCFKSLVFDFDLIIKYDQVVVDRDQLRNVVTVPPYKLEELKLLQTRVLKMTEASLMAFLDGLFWSCHPDVLSITTCFENTTAKLIMNILKRNEQHLLKSIEVEGVYYPSSHSESPELTIKFRLSWVSV